MTDEAMSPLRRRMIEDMTIRKLAPDTQRNYIRSIKNFATFIDRSPDKASFEDVRRFCIWPRTALHTQRSIQLCRRCASSSELRSSGMPSSSTQASFTNLGGCRSC